MDTKKKSHRHFSRKQLFNIAYAYAYFGYTHHDFSRQYHCGQHVFYKVLHLAVDTLVVSDTVAYKMQQVAVSKSRQRAKENSGSNETADSAAVRVQRSWDKRIKNRKNFNFDKQESIQITTRYANSPMNKSQFCRFSYLPPELFDRTLKRAIINDWVDDIILEKLQKKSEQFYGKEIASAFFGNLILKREENKCQKDKQ